MCDMTEIMSIALIYSDTICILCEKDNFLILLNKLGTSIFSFIYFLLLTTGIFLCPNAKCCYFILNLPLKIQKKKKKKIIAHFVQSDHDIHFVKVHLATLCV